jgi:predicted ATPase/DNA-binding winged helix-turn-helix (wHTH) protein
LTAIDRNSAMPSRVSAEQIHRTRGGISFGPFRLLLAERLLERAGAPVHVGARALEILNVLIEHAGEIVGKQELMTRVWQQVTVDEGSLRFHISALRKALGDAQSGARYITTVPGRGYCFVAQTSRCDLMASPATTSSDDQFPELPTCLGRMVGRDDVVTKISSKLLAHKFVSIVGPGGIGKTAVAVSVCHAQVGTFDGVVRFLDLGLLNDPALVPGALASTLGLSASASDATSRVISFLRDKRMLLVLDSCEHVIEAAAQLAEGMFDEAPHVHLLATSREPLRVEGEHVHRLSPLESPPDDARLSATEALNFPAAQLFSERVAAAGCRFELATHASVVGEICRRLDGIPLALELAAGQVDAYGLHETAALLDGQLRLPGCGRRTAPDRHRTLSATLDWSYNLLTERERLVLRRLAIFPGTFTLEAVRLVVADDHLDEAQVLVDLANLVAKSMVDATSDSGTVRYWLLGTTRVYALAKLMDSADAATTAERHAGHFLQLFDPGALGLRLVSGAGDPKVIFRNASRTIASHQWAI